VKPREIADVHAADALVIGPGQLEQLDLSEFRAHMLNGTLGAEDDAPRTQATHRLADGDEGADGGLEIDVLEAHRQLDRREIGSGKTHMAEHELQSRKILQQKAQRVDRGIALRDDMRVERHVAIDEIVAQLLDLGAEIGHAVDERAQLEAAEAAADRLIEAKGLKQISDTGALDAIIDEVMAANQKSVDEYRSGKEKAFNALIGQAMKATKGRANPQQVTELLKKKLSS